MRSPRPKSLRRASTSVGVCFGSEAGVRAAMLPISARRLRADMREPLAANRLGPEADIRRNGVMPSGFGSRRGRRYSARQCGVERPRHCCRMRLSSEGPFQCRSAPIGVLEVLQRPHDLRLRWGFCASSKSLLLVILGRDLINTASSASLMATTPVFVFATTEDRRIGVT